MAMLVSDRDPNGLLVTYMATAAQAKHNEYYSKVPCASCGGALRVFVYNNIYQCPCMIEIGDVKLINKGQ